MKIKSLIISLIAVIGFTPVVKPISDTQKAVIGGACSLTLAVASIYFYVNKNKLEKSLEKATNADEVIAIENKIKLNKYLMCGSIVGTLASAGITAWGIHGLYNNSKNPKKAPKKPDVKNRGFIVENLGRKHMLTEQEAMNILNDINEKIIADRNFLYTHAKSIQERDYFLTGAPELEEEVKKQPNRISKEEWTKNFMATDTKETREVFSKQRLEQKYRNNQNMPDNIKNIHVKIINGHGVKNLTREEKNALLNFVMATNLHDQAANY